MTNTFQQSEVYTHPNIRNLTVDQLHARLTATRQRRLITAIEFQSAQTKRIDKEGSKLSDQWLKAHDQTLTQLAHATAAVEKAEKLIAKMQQLSNQLAVIE
jgi:ABC-type Fe3+-hydroxamate transport system substrate-binding protein